jgi:hypothetical protein
MRAALALLLLLAGGCAFDASRADPYRCHAGACPVGLMCEHGLCVASADGGAADAAAPDAAAVDAPASDAPDDGPGDAVGPGGAGPEVGAPGDGPPPDGAPPADAGPGDAGPADARPTDAGPTDAAPDGARDGAAGDAGVTCTTDPLTTNLGHFQPLLTAASWGYGTNGYAQTWANDLHVSWVNAPGGAPVSITATVTLTGQGLDDFNTPTGRFSVAGLMVRPSGLTATNIQGYLCGLDLRNGRVLLGRMDGPYLAGQGNLVVLGQQTRAVAQYAALPLSLAAQGATITCTSGTTTVSATDATFAAGSVGLFTIGATARFRDATYCLP